MPVIRAVSLVLAHVPSLVRLGSKPLRVLREVEQPIEYLRPHLRDWDAARTYAPNQVFIGNLGVDDLAARPTPWHRHPLVDAGRFGPDGEIMPEHEFLGLLATCDGFDLFALDGEVAEGARGALDAHPLVGRESGRPPVPAGVTAALLRERIERHRAVPLVGADGRLLGAMLPGHDEDDTLTGQVLLENLACKATAALALRHLLAQPGAIAASNVRYVINCGEEAVGDRYQRGGGNVAKAVAEWAGCGRATGSDVKAFCSGPMHALMIAGALVRSGLYDDVMVLAGGSLAKLGMKFQGHVKHAMPIVEDVLAGFAAQVSRDDGVSPVLRLDAIGRHEVASGSAPLAIMKALYSEPLGRVGLTLLDVDRFSLELHNPEATEPAGSGNVPLNNYRTLASLAVVEKLIAREGIEEFVRTRGMPGFSPTQGHIASAIPYLGHARRGLTDGDLTRTMFAGKGSLFLGRMTQLPDGLSLVLERNESRAGAD
ncbi:MAG: glycine reductase [Candidatus Rokuibacteriota bacterium]|nr:MAG: glycine reductase [Candidatus Rokubacteria bacterium]